MARKSLSTILSLTIMVPLIEDAFALHLPFAKRATNSTPASPGATTLPMPIHFDGRGGYQVPVQMASNSPQTFNFTISTGSGLTFAAGQSCAECSNTPLYNQGASTSAVSLSGSDNTTWFGTTTSGNLIKENCGALLQNGSFWQYPNQTVVVVNSQSSSLLANGISGIFGLGTNGGSTGSSASGVGFNDTIYGQFLNRNPSRANFTFGMMLNSLPASGSASAGTDGGILHWTKPDDSFFDTSKVTYKTLADTSSSAGNTNGTTINTGQDWTVGLDGWVATVGNTHLSNTDTVVAVVDPLYPNIYLPGDQAKLIHDTINGSALSGASTLSGLSQTYSIPCDAQFSFGFLVGSQTFVLNPEQLILQQGNGTCVSAIEGFTDSSLTQYLVGSRFISTIYLIFNIPRDGPPTLGFSPRTSPGKSTNVGAIVGGTVGGVAFVIILGLVAFWYLRRRADRRMGPFEIEDADKPVQQAGVEPYMVGAPTPAQPSIAPTTPLPTQPLLLGEESHGPLPPPSYEEASSSAGSPVASRPNPPRGDVKGRRVPVPSMSISEMPEMTSPTETHAL
ncbi:acid protease [Phanerochaete sordida]|uniref:Acid protease n=1 Tax=Phanerochaete sordida TaxID=48140 RepID=A0A9P3GG58_9APHY|nr:acid protease [Phanerochaete sordida]